MRFAMRFALILALGLAAWAELGAGVAVQVRVARANAREEPDSGAAVMAVLQRGEVRPLLDEVPYWYEIRLRNGRTAYVAKSLCRLVLEEEEDAGQTEAEMYAVPPAAPAVSVPGCSPGALTVSWGTCPQGGTPGGHNEAANMFKNRVSWTCLVEPFTVDQVLALKALPREVRALPASDVKAVYLNNLEARAVRLEGFLAMTKDGGPESVNCGSTTRKDIHLEITASGAADAKFTRNRHVVTEVTPWFKEAIAGWTTPLLRVFASYRGGYSGNRQRDPAQARIYGWLFYDDPHASDGSVGTWRGTAWEVHPITSIEVFENGAWRVIQ